MKRGRAKRKRSGEERDRPKKKALAGPPKRAGKKRPKRRGIVAARKRRRETIAARARKWTRRVDRRVDRLLLGAEPLLVRGSHRTRAAAARWSRRLQSWSAPIYRLLGKVARWVGRRLRPLAVLALRLLALLDRLSRRVLTWMARAATRASAVLTPERGVCCLIVVASLLLLAAQFVDYRVVEAGQPAYAGLDSIAAAPVVESNPATEAHSYVLVPLALLGAGLGVFALLRGRLRLGRIVFGLGAASLAVVLLFDISAGLDLSGQASRFAGATAVLSDGFYAQLAAATGMMLGGLLLAYAPSKRLRRTRASAGPKRSGSRSKTKRARKPGLGRTQGGAVRERTSGA